MTKNLPSTVSSKLDMTIQDFKDALPKHMRKSVNPKTVASINDIIRKPAMAEHFRDNLISYTKVLQDGKYKISAYINAVKYVSYKLMGMSNQDSYRLTFPDRWKRFEDKSLDDKSRAAYITAYSNGQMVNMIYEQALIPSHVLNADMFQKALNTQADLMQHAKSEKVRSDAANSILHHLKRPETTKIELDLGIKEDESLIALKESTMELVKQQRLMLESNMMNAKEIAHTEIVITATEDDDEDIMQEMNNGSC